MVEPHVEITTGGNGAPCLSGWGVPGRIGHIQVTQEILRIDILTISGMEGEMEHG